MIEVSFLTFFLGHSIFLEVFLLLLSMKKIRIVSPAKQIEAEAVFFAKDFLEKQNFEVEIGKNALGRSHYFSGTFEERLADFQDALDDESVNFILCSRGGYGSVQLIDELNFDKFLKYPKLIIGYSDITVFHNHIFSTFNLPTVHGTVPLNFFENTTEALDSLLNVLNNKNNRYEFPTNKHNCFGQTEGIVIGGNLAILYSLLGTNSDIIFSEKILFIEDVGEAIYAIDRMFYSFKKANKLAQLKGVIIGGMTNMKDSEIPYGKSVEEVIHEHLSPLNIPVAFDFPAGHIDDNRSLIIGKAASLSVNGKRSIFEQIMV